MLIAIVVILVQQDNIILEQETHHVVTVQQENMHQELEIHHVQRVQKENISLQQDKVHVGIVPQDIIVLLQEQLLVQRVLLVSIVMKVLVHVQLVRMDIIVQELKEELHVQPVMQEMERVILHYQLDAMDAVEDHIVVLQEVHHVQHVPLEHGQMKHMQHHVMLVRMDIIVLEV